MPHTIVAALNIFISSFPFALFLRCRYEHFGFRLRRPAEIRCKYTVSAAWPRLSRLDEGLTAWGHVTECGQRRCGAKPDESQ
jgi:hypothetical protein